MQSMTAFPFTSVLTYDEHGWPQLDRGVTSEVLRKILKSFIPCFLVKEASSFRHILRNNQGGIREIGACVYGQTERVCNFSRPFLLSSLLLKAVLCTAPNILLLTKA